MAENVSKHSHGRGGAGNMATDPGHPPSPTDLVTPTLKSDHYTTGRGGSGNIARNDPERPELARAAQDVGPVAQREQAVFHTGRGGAANVGGERKGERKEEEKREKEERERREEGIVERGKGFLGKLMGDRKGEK